MATKKIMPKGPPDFDGDWRRALEQILRRRNNMHAHAVLVDGVPVKGTRNVLHSTRDARKLGLMRCFRLLHKMGFKIMPAGLGGRHIAALVQHWSADPRAAEMLAKEGRVLPPRTMPLSDAYMKQHLSFLRVLAGWLGKTGMVKSLAFYVADPALTNVTLTSAHDLSCSGNGVDIAIAIDAILARVTAIDKYVGVQLAMMIAFGLRRKEAVMFAPHLAEVPVNALPPGAGATRYLAFVSIKRCTKGGRVRYTAVRNERQAQALALALALVQDGPGHVGRPGHTLNQAVRRFSNVLRCAGVTHAQLGVTPHDLRHKFAGDLYFELSCMQPPVRHGEGGAVPNPACYTRAYLEVARQLGLRQSPIASAYLASPPAGDETRAAGAQEKPFPRP